MTKPLILTSPQKNILFAYTQKLYSNCSNTGFSQNKLLPPRLWNTGLVSSRASLTLWGEGASLALVGHPSSDGVMIKMPYPPRIWNTGLVSSEAGLASWGEGSSLALVGHPSSDCITIKMPYEVDVSHWPASHPIFSYWIGLVKTEFGRIVKSIETGLGRWMLVVAVNIFGAYPFFGFLSRDLTLLE